MTFAQRRNRLTTLFSEIIPVFKWRIYLYRPPRRVTNSPKDSFP